MRFGVLDLAAETRAEIDSAFEAKLTDAGPKRCADDDDDDGDGDSAEGSDANEDTPRLCVRWLPLNDEDAASSTSVPFASSSPL